MRNGVYRLHRDEGLQARTTTRGKTSGECARAADESAPTDPALAYGSCERPDRVRLQTRNGTVMGMVTSSAFNVTKPQKMRQFLTRAESA